jgi:hypothetical protein
VVPTPPVVEIPTEVHHLVTVTPETEYATSAPFFEL